MVALYFTPPSVLRRPEGERHRLFRLVPERRGLAVTRYTDGRIVVSDEAPLHTDPGVARVWSSGRKTLVSQDDYDALLESGYGQYLEVQ